MLVLNRIFHTELQHRIGGESIMNLLLGYCKALSPLEVLEDYPAFIALKHAHLLELLYRLIVLTEPPQEDARKGAAPMAGIEFVVNVLLPPA